MKSKRDDVLRKVRIIVSDPYATDSSTDEELESPKPRKVKRIVYEINLHSQSQLTDGCDGVKPSRKKSPKKPVGVRLRPSGKWAAEITNPITKTKKWLGTYETLKEAEKAYADKKVEYDTLVSSSPPVSSSVVNSQSFLSSASALPCGNVDDSTEVFSNFDFSDLQIPDLSFLREKDSISGANDADLDLDCLLMDDFSLLDNDINFGFENSGPSELPDCDFTDLELDLVDSKFAFADQLASPLNIACP